MSFISPWFLAGMLAIAIPIYLHLFHKKNPIIQAFPSLRLIKDSIEHLAKRKKLRNLLLMALRVFAIILVVLALARPFIGKSASANISNQTPSATIILLDNSMSMSKLSKGVSAFNTAKTKALEIIAQMQPQDIATVGFINEPGGLALSQLTWDKEALKKIVANAQPTIRGTDLAGAIAPSLKLLTPLKTHKKALFVISDMTSNAWEPFISKYDIAEIDKSIDLILVPVGGSEADNTAVTALSIENPIVMTKQETKVKAVLANYSGTSKKIRATLAINKERKAAQEIDLEKNTEKEIIFTTSFTNSGVNHLSVAISGDTMLADNERHMVVKAYDPCKILIIKPETLAGEKEGQEDLFLRFAINPLNKTKNNNFITETRATNELNNLKLRSYAAIILADIRRLDEEFIKNLSNYVLAGGNLISFLGNRCQPDWYNESLYNNLGGAYILPAKLHKRVGNAVSKNVYYQLTDLDTGHPSFKLFASEENGEPSRARIYEFFQATPNEQALVLARMSHGFPAIIEEARGAGKSMLVVFPADTKWSNWPLRPTWLPFLHQTLISMITSKDISINNAKPGIPISISVYNSDAKLFLNTPDQQVLPLDLHKSSSIASHIIVRETELGGYYSIGAQGAEPIAAFAVNPPPEESNLTRINIRNIPRFITIKETSSSDSIKSSVANLRDGYDLSLITLVTLILLALVENYLANLPIKKRGE